MTFTLKHRSGENLPWNASVSQTFCPDTVSFQRTKSCLHFVSPPSPHCSSPQQPARRANRTVRSPAQQLAQALAQQPQPRLTVTYPMVPLVVPLLVQPPAQPQTNALRGDAPPRRASPRYHAGFTAGRRIICLFPKQFTQAQPVSCFSLRSPDAKSLQAQPLGQAQAQSRPMQPVTMSRTAQPLAGFSGQGSAHSTDRRASPRRGGLPC